MTDLGREDDDHYGYLNELPLDLQNDELDISKGKKKDEHTMDDLPHYGDERGAIFNHDVGHYYDETYAARTPDYFEWPTPTHVQIDPTTSATVEHMQLDWPAAVAAAEHSGTVYYDAADEHMPAATDFAVYSGHDPDRWYDHEHPTALEHRVK